MTSVCPLSKGRLASASDDTVCIWDLESDNNPYVLNAHTDIVNSVCYLGDRYLASASHDITLGIWDMNSRKLLSLLEGHTSPVLSVCYLGDGLLASASWDNTLRLWDIRRTLNIKVQNRPRSLVGNQRPQSLIKTISRKSQKNIGSGIH